MAKSRVSAIERAKAKESKVKASFTFDAVMFKRFQELCKKKKVAQSRLLEILIQDLFESEELE